MPAGFYGALYFLGVIVTMGAATLDMGSEKDEGEWPLRSSARIVGPIFIFPWYWYRYIKRHRKHD